MSSGSDVEYGKKEFVILKHPDVVTSVRFSISANSLTHNMRTKNKLYLMVSGRTGRFLVVLAGLSNLKCL